mgnify:CR=1 FL=1
MYFNVLLGDILSSFSDILSSTTSFVPSCVSRGDILSESVRIGLFSPFFRGDILAFASFVCFLSAVPDILSELSPSFWSVWFRGDILAFALSARFMAALTLDADGSSHGSVGRFDSLQITFHTMVW